MNTTLIAWLAASYEERHCEIEVTCSYPYSDPVAMHYAVTLTDFRYSGPPEPSSTGDHSASFVSHVGHGSTVDEAINQALTQQQSELSGT